MAAFFRRFFGSSVNTAAGYAIGGAITPALNPLTQGLANEAWSLHPNMPLDPLFLAEGYVQGQIPYDIARTKALNSGIDKENFDLAAQALDNGPGVSEAFTLWRRGDIDEAGFRRALNRNAIEQEWIDALVKIHDVLLSPADLANAVVQGHMTLAAATTEASLWGVTPARFGVLVENTGLPPGPETLLAWKRRGIATDAEFQTGILEGHTKPKYIPFYEKAAQPLLSAATAVRLYLKGWYTKAQRDALGALWGYSSQQMEDWFLSEGRPATVHQIHIGYARGANLPGAASEVEAIRTAVKESDVRPEYADLLVAQRYTYPSAFVLRGLVTSKAISQAEGEQALVFSGWEPTFAAKAAAFWAGGTTGVTADPHLGKAQVQLWSATHKSYVAREITPATASASLQAAGVVAGSVAGVLTLWNEERAMIHAQLSPAQVKKAYVEQVRNPSTGAPWSLQDAVTALLDRGYSDADARTLLAE